MRIPILIGMVGAGIIIGALYFGGLWLTLNRLTKTKSWSLWLGFSFLVRSSIAVAGFWLLGNGDWQRIVALLTGFMIVRFLSIKQIRPESLQTS